MIKPIKNIDSEGVSDPVKPDPQNIETAKGSDKSIAALAIPNKPGFFKRICRVFTSPTAKKIYHYLPFLSRIIEKFSPVKITPIAEIIALIAGGGAYSAVTPNTHIMHFNILVLICSIISLGIGYAIKHLRNKPIIKGFLEDLQGTDDKLQQALSDDSPGGSDLTHQEKEAVIQDDKSDIGNVVKAITDRFL
jgi:hypothetical protein